MGWNRLGEGGELRVLCRFIDFEFLQRYLSGEVKQIFGYVGLEFRGQVNVRDVNL